MLPQKHQELGDLFFAAEKQIVFLGLKRPQAREGIEAIGDHRAHAAYPCSITPVLVNHL